MLHPGHNGRYLLSELLFDGLHDRNFVKTPRKSLSSHHLLGSVTAQEEQKDCVHFLVSESRLLSNFNLGSISNYLDALYDKRWTLFSFCGIVFLYFF